MKKSDKNFEFPLQQPKGIYEFFNHYAEIKAAAYDRGDMDALSMLIDFNQALRHVKFTARQEEAIYFVFILGLSQQEAGSEMGVTQQAVQRFLFLATSKLADHYKHRRNESESH